MTTNTPTPAHEAVLTDDQIEALAKKHIAPHADLLDEVLPNRVPYQQTQQFRRVKALIADVLYKARAELIAEMECSVVGFVTPGDIDLLQRAYGSVPLHGGSGLPHMLPEDDRVPLARIPKAESAVLSKLRAPKPLGDSCHHCGWTDWVSQDGAAYCQACGKPHGSVPAEGLPNLPQLLRENADLDEAEGGNAQVCALERDAADEIERLRREVAKLRAPVADERLADRLDRMAFAQPTGSQAQSDLLAAAAIWRKHVNHSASAPVAGEAQKPVAYRAWFDQDHGARWLFTLWPEEERLDVQWEPLYAAPQATRNIGRLLDAAHTAVEILDNLSDHADAKLASVELSNAAAAIAVHEQAAPQASEAVRDARALIEKLEAWQAVCDRIVDQYGGVVAGVDFAALGRANRAALSAQPGAQKKGGSNAK